MKISIAALLSVLVSTSALANSGADSSDFPHDAASTANVQYCVEQKAHGLSSSDRDRAAKVIAVACTVGSMTTQAVRPALSNVRSGE